MISIENKMPDLTDRERKILSKHTKSIINQLLKEPILQAKEMANSPKANEQLRLFQQIFGIEDAVEAEVTAMTEQELERKNAYSRHNLPLNQSILSKDNYVSRCNFRIISYTFEFFSRTRFSTDIK